MNIAPFPTTVVFKSLIVYDKYEFLDGKSVYLSFSDSPSFIHFHIYTKVGIFSMHIFLCKNEWFPVGMINRIAICHWDQLPKSNNNMRLWSKRDHGSVCCPIYSCDLAMFWIMLIPFDYISFRDLKDLIVWPGVGVFLYFHV